MRVDTSYVLAYIVG